MDYAPVHLITTATLAAVTSAAGAAPAPQVFRPNLILATLGLSGIPVEGSGLQTRAGVYAKVVSPGRVRAGDEVRVGPATASTPGARPR